MEGQPLPFAFAMGIFWGMVTTRCQSHGAVCGKNSWLKARRHGVAWLPFVVAVTAVPRLFRPSISWQWYASRRILFGFRVVMSTVRYYMATISENPTWPSRGAVGTTPGSLSCVTEGTGASFSRGAADFCCILVPLLGLAVATSGLWWWDRSPGASLALSEVVFALVMSFSELHSGHLDFQN